MKKIKKSRIIIAGIFIFILFVIIYNIFDNQRFVVIRQEITINRLPEEFDGYRILQISDLHSKYFGEGQEKLLLTINSMDYDCILFTGDMNKDIDSSLSDSQAIIDLIDGIKNKKLMIWVDGNTGPFAIDSVDGSLTGELTPIGTELADRGIEILLSPIPIERNGQTIWFVPEMSKLNYLMQYSSVSEDRFKNFEQYQKVISYGEELKNWCDKLLDNGEVKIHVNHFPVQANLTQEDWASIGYLDYDLTIAGHYHGGQIRIPFYGAIYIPSPTSGIHYGYFPNQNEVKGLNQILGMQQYISAGLGTSNSISFLDFRFFDTPEINLLILRCRK